MKLKCEYCDAKPLRNEPILLAGTEGPAGGALQTASKFRRRRFCRYHALRHKNTCQPRLLRTGVCGRRRRRGIRTSAYCGYFCGTPLPSLTRGGTAPSDFAIRTAITSILRRMLVNRNKEHDGSMQKRTADKTAVRFYSCRPYTLQLRFGRNRRAALRVEDAPSPPMTPVGLTPPNSSVPSLSYPR